MQKTIDCSEVLKNIFSGEYTKKEKLEALAWGEKNREKLYAIISEFHPKYAGNKHELSVLSIMLMKDLGIMDKDLNLTL